MSARPPWVRRRRRLLLATALPAVLVLLLAVKLVSLPVLTGSAAGAHESGDGGGVRSAGERLGVANLVERWRAPYIEGTGQAMAGDLEDGRADLERALGQTSSPEDDCTVRTNLVLTIERQSAAAGEAEDTEAEQRLAEEALALIEDGPKGCLDGSQDGNGGEAGEKQREAQQRLEERAQEQDGDEGDEQDEPEEPEPTEPPQDPEAQRKAEELQDKNSAAQAEAEAQQRRDEARRPPSDRSVEKPW